jgi:hypothetical protein
LNGLYLGADASITLNLTTVDPSTLLKPLWPIPAASRSGMTLANVGAMPVIGGLASDYLAQTLTLVKVAGPASSPNAFSASKAMLSPDFSVRVPTGPMLHRMPLRLTCLPYLDTGKIKFFTTPSTSPVVPAIPTGFMAGAYAVTWNELAVGDTEQGSLTYEFAHFWEPIVGDAMGKTIVDYIYQGSVAYINCVTAEANAAAMASMLWPFGDATPAQGIIENATTGTIGTLIASLAKAAVLTPLAGTPIAAVIDNVTAPLTLLAPGHEISTRLGPTLRKIPVRLVCFPDAGTLFTITGVA